MFEDILFIKNFEKQFKEIKVYENVIKDINNNINDNNKNDTGKKEYQLMFENAHLRKKKNNKNKDNLTTD